MSDDPAIACNHRHAFLGEHHERNARKTRIVVGLSMVMMAVEIGAGLAFHSMALLADGLHMATHAGSMLVTAAAYFYAHRHIDDPRFSLGTGKFGHLAAFGSAVVLASTAIAIAIESLHRLMEPSPIAFAEALPVAVLGLVVNLASAWFLREETGPGHDHAHHHGHHDLNLRAAYAHVVSDAGLSVLAIVGLLAGSRLGWVWLDPVMGLVGTVVIGRWSLKLMRQAGGVLLDMTSDEALKRAVRERLETGGDRIVDLHLWRVGPGHTAAIISLESAAPQPPSAYKHRLADLPTLSHVTVEVEPK